MRHFSIKKILIFLFLIVPLVTISFSLVQRYFWLQKHERERIEQDYLPVAESMGKTVEIALNRRLAVLKQVSNEVLKAGINSNEVQKIIESVHYRNPDFKTIWVGNPEGKAVAFSPLYDEKGNRNIGRDYSDRNYFKKVKALKQPVIGEIIVGRVAKEPVISLAVPILDKNNEFKGFVFAGYSPEPIRQIIRTIRIYGRGNLTLVDEYGKTIVMSNSHEFEREMKDLSSMNIFKEAAKNKIGTAEFISPVDNRKKIGAFYSLSNGWKIWASRDVEEMQQTIMGSFVYAVLWGAIALFIAIGIAYVLSGYISRPVISLKRYSERLASGDFSVIDEGQAYKCVISELSDMNESFFKMAGDLKALYENLEQKIQERTKLLSNANEELQLLNAELQTRRAEAEDARAQADAATRAKSEFLANMSHELRTPLNSILGFSELLMSGITGDLTPEQKEQVSYISLSGKHLLNLIDDILDLSKVEAGKLELELSAVSLKDVLNSSIIMLREKAIKHNIKLSLEIESDADIEIEADERKLKQIVFNLLSNAVKFTPDGGSVRVSARRVDSSWLIAQGKIDELTAMSYERNRDFVEISVADTGIGIKQEEMAKLFQPFQQLESAYTKKYEGTGLGLALTKRLVELHGGRIWAESEFGKGSVFTFVIPMKQEKTGYGEESADN